MKQQTKWPIWISLTATLIAIGVHLYLTQHHYQLVFGASESESLCNINEAFSCDSVNTSIFSELLGVPLALWGALTNAVLMLLFLWQLLSSSAHFARRLSFYMSTFVLLSSVVMALISFTQLGTFCLFCMGAYFLSAVAWAGAYVGTKPIDLSLLPSDIKSLFDGGEEGARSYLILLLAVPALTFLFDNMIVSSFVKNFDVVVQESINSWKANPVNAFDTSTGLRLKNSELSAKMTIVEFADFGCPHCKRAAPSLHAFAKSRKDVQLIFLNYPLDGACNPAVPREGRTCELAKRTHCAEKSGKGWAAHEYMFRNQGRSEELMVEKMLKALNLEESAFNLCLSAPETTEVIRRQATEGMKAKIEGTPAVFVNGKQLPAGFFIPILEAAYKTL
jgi:protein-disulfide isomerase/uncharacterized membrane protein